mgnify:CR=1 FL=1
MRRAAALLLLLGAAPAVAQTASSQVRVQVNRAGTLTKTQDLDFGRLIAGATAGRAVVGTNGTRTRTGGVTLAGGTVSAARFRAQSAPNQRFTIQLPTSPVTLTRAGGGATMTVSNFTRNPGGGGPRLNAAGIRDISVGARLNVAANQPAGSYAGTFNVTVNFQ